MFTCGLDRSNFSFAIALSVFLCWPTIRRQVSSQLPNSVVRVQSEEPTPKLRSDSLQAGEIQLTNLSLIASWKTGIFALCLLAQKALFQDLFELADTNS